MDFYDYLHKLKYRLSGCSFEEHAAKIAHRLTADTVKQKKFSEILSEKRFLPAGRIQLYYGNNIETTAFNCFVSGIIPDSFVDYDNYEKSSIMHRATQAAATLRMGGGIGYDFSTLRPKNSTIKKLGSSSSGPISFMGLFNSIATITCSAGHRRGAQMGVLRVDHPDIEEFITAKCDNNSLNAFNISVAITDKFMRAVIENKEYDLIFEGDVYKQVDAKYIWEKIIDNAFVWSEPGLLFIDRINEMNNLYYCENITATNPCGEQPLPPFGACLLGSINLVKYLVKYGDNYRLNTALIEEDIPYIVEALNNIFITTKYPLSEQVTEALNKRRMGIGITGVANAIEIMGFSYASDKFLVELDCICKIIRDALYTASTEQAIVHGSFPMYDKKYLDSKFIATLPSHIIKKIERYGIRNSHLTSIAPTGTISLCADNISSGIEPVFSRTISRDVFMDSKKTSVLCHDYAYENYGISGKEASKVTIDEHLSVIKCVLPYQDSAVSKTCNFFGVCDNFKHGVTKKEFADKLIDLWQSGGKGISIFNINGSRAALLKKSQKDLSCKIDEKTGLKDCE